MVVIIIMTKTNKQTRSEKSEETLKNTLTNTDTNKNQTDQRFQAEQTITNSNEQ